MPLAVVSINNNSTLTKILLAVEMREWRGGKAKTARACRARDFCPVSTTDPLFPNEELEYYTKRKGVHKLYLFSFASCSLELRNIARREGTALFQYSCD